MHGVQLVAIVVRDYDEAIAFYVGVLGNGRPEALPVVELDLSKIPHGTPKIAGTEVKWDEDTDVYRNTQPVFPKDLGEDLTQKLKDVAVQAFHRAREPRAMNGERRTTNSAR